MTPLKYPSRVETATPQSELGWSESRNQKTMMWWRRVRGGHILAVWLARPEANWGFSVDGCQSTSRFSRWEDAHEAAIDELNRVLTFEADL